MKADKGFKSGSITVHLCLVLCVLISLVFACIDSARLSAGRAALACGVDQGLFSLFSNYDRFLYEEYGLLFLDGGYSKEELNFGGIVDEITEYTQKALTPSSGMFLKTPKDLFGIQLDSADVTGYILATDSKFTPLIDQIAEIMPMKLGVNGLKSLQSSMDTYTEAVGTYALESEDEVDALINRYEEQKELAKEIEEKIEYEEADENFTGESSQSTDVVEVPENFKNPIENTKELRKLGLMALVLPKDKDISSASVELSDMLSRRTLNNGMGILPETKGDAGKKFLTAEFGIGFFNNFLNGPNTDTLGYQAEYVISGKASDVDNLKSVLNSILLIREGFNYIYLLSSVDKTDEIYEMAAIISVIILQPEAVEAIAQILRLCWAYVESMMDIKSLLEGGKVPLFKDAESWQVSFSLFEVASPDSSTKKGGKGLGYTDYLRVLLNLLPEDQLFSRTADMIEYNRRQEGADSFCLDSCISAFQIEYSGKIGKHSISINRSYGYDIE